MRELYICNTIYHVMVVCCLKKYLKKDTAAVLWISDHTRQAEAVCRRMQQTDCGFDSIQFIKTKIYQETIYSNQQIIEESKDKVRKQLCGLADDFTHIYTANFDFFTCTLMEEWRDRDITYSLFEDGLGTYSYEGRAFSKEKISFPASMISDIYVFYPDKMSWRPDKTLIQIPCELRSDEKLRELFREIFLFRSLQDSYEERFIFFEDGFAEWRGNEDMELLEYISRIAGKENFFVKSHPRNDPARYVKAGYRVNKDTCVPWEVVAMNMELELEHKVLLTFYSQAVIMPFMLTGTRYRAIILGKILHCDDERAKQYFQYMDRYYYSKYKDIFFVPESVEELKEYLEQLPG